MVYIYTFCDKTLVGKKENSSAIFLCENLYKMNNKIESCQVFCNAFDFESLNFKNKNIYFLLMQRSSATLNSYLAKLTGSELAENEMLKEAVGAYYKQINTPADKNSELEYFVPSSCIPITNPNGKTQGYSVKVGESEIFVLPNEFEQLKKIFYDCLYDYLIENYPNEYKVETYKTFGIAEDSLKQLLSHKMKNKDKVYITIFSKGLDNDVVIKAKKDNDMFEKYTREVYDILNKYIYSAVGLSMRDSLSKSATGTFTRLAVVGDISAAKLMNDMSIQTINDNIVFAEILPNKASKLAFGVSSETMVDFGEVSPEVAYDIALKTLKKSNAEIIVVSLVSLVLDSRGTSFVAIGNKSKVDIYKNHFDGTDEQILLNTSQTAMFYLNQKLSNREF